MRRGPTTRPRLDVPREPRDDFAVVYTSGTTGPSKGVRLPYASHWLYARSFVWSDIGEDDRYLLTLPMFHVAGTSVTYAMLARGGRVVLSGPFHPKTFWVHTGDQMSVDEHGEYVFVDRVKDAIRRRGENISSYEVEVEVLSHDDVDQAAAVGVANPDVDEEASEQEVKIVVVPVEGRTIDPLELTEYLIPRMPRHMFPATSRSSPSCPALRPSRSRRRS